MTDIQVDEHVQLTKDIPELGLRCGELGLVCSIWFNPTSAYEVEFRREMPNCGMRALLMHNQIRGTQTFSTRANADLYPAYCTRRLLGTPDPHAIS
jgi:hypothetical protein